MSGPVYTKRFWSIPLAPGPGELASYVVPGGATAIVRRWSYTPRDGYAGGQVAICINGIFVGEITYPGSIYQTYGDPDTRIIVQAGETLSLLNDDTGHFDLYCGGYQLSS